MSPPSIQNCPKCREPILSAGPDGGCPRCLMDLACAKSVTLSASSGGFELPEPTTLQRHFPELEIGSILGRGGMGAVYRARQTKLDRPVALKILAPHHAADPVLAERFLREARTLARLSHPHIVSIHDVGQAGDYWYILMEFVDGASLRGLIQDGALSADEAVRLVPQICDAMQYAHDHGVVHRDIKPENVLVDQNGQVKIADFGIAKLIGEPQSEHVTLTSAGTRLGTSGYMAPEQSFNTADVDHRADIYSLGIMFYEMLTGKLPTPNYTPPSRVREVDIRLDRVVERSLRNAPEERFQRAAELKQALEKIASSDSTVARLRLAVFVLLACVAGIAGFVGWTQYRVQPAAVISLEREQANALTGNVAEDAESISALTIRPLQVPLSADEAVAAQEAWARKLNIPIERHDAAGITLRLVPPGVFELAPDYTVAITRPFYAGQTEVTVAQFRQFVNDTHYATQAESSGMGGFVHVEPRSPRIERDPAHAWHHPRFSSEDDRAVGLLTVADMEQFCQWLGKREGCTYRLPTEAEWNWAARAGIATTNMQVVTSDEAAKIGWFYDESDNVSHQVARKRPNAWGFYDMFGNMCEMCADGWEESFPKGRFENPLRPASHGRRPGMGSSFADPHWAVRMNLNDGFPFHSVGFRVVREIPMP